MDEYDDYDEDEDFDYDEEMDELEREDLEDDYDNLSDSREERIEERFGMNPEEAGYADGEFDSTNDIASYSSYGASIDLDELSDDERDAYDSAYHSGLEENR